MRSLAYQALVALSLTRLSTADLPYPKSEIALGDSGLPLYVISNSGLSVGDQVTLETLSGVLARYTPRVYTVSDPTDHTEPATFWLDRLVDTYNIKVNTTYVEGDLPGLLKHFADQIDGYVQFDAATNSTNAAITRCSAASSSLVAVGESATGGLLEALGVSMVHDATSESPLNAYTACNANLSKRVGVFQPDDGSKGAFMTGYAVMSRAPVTEFSTPKEDEYTAVVSDFSSELNAAYGWFGEGIDEYHYVGTLATHGTYAHASDWSMNLQTLTNVGAVAAPPAASADVGEDAASANTDVHTVAFVMSDGDNVCWLQSGWLGDSWYGAPTRGAVSMGWTFAPAAATELMPLVYDWAVSSATANDTFMAGPSGAGYTYPDKYSPAQTTEFAEATESMMGSMGASLLNIIGGVPSAESVRPLASLDGVDAVLYYTYGDGYSGLRGNVAYVEGTPVIGGRATFWGEENDGSDMLGSDGIVALLESLPKDTSDPNSYSIIPVHAWSHTYADVVELGARLQALGGFDIVLPEVLVKRLKANAPGVETCPMASGSWAESCQDCTVSGYGDGCVLTCTDCAGERASCDLATCHEELSLGPEKTFLCADGSACPSS